MRTVSPVRKSHRMPNKLLLKAVECLGVAALLMLLCSCISFDIGDWPSRFAYPHNAPPVNLCGSIGAFFAYYLMYYIGPGVFVILVSAVCFLVAKLAHRPIGQPVLRAIGLGLLTVAVSSSFYCFWPYRVYSFPAGSGGALGVGTAHFLRSHFALLGTSIARQSALRHRCGRRRKPAACGPEAGKF